LPRQRSPNRDKAKELYISSGGTIKFSEIAKQLNLKESQIRKWKCEDNWDDELNGIVTNMKSNKRIKLKSKTKSNKRVTNQSTINSEISFEILNEQQKLFAEIYVNNFNATQAAIKAGYGINNANVIGCRLLKDVNVRNYVGYLKDLKRDSLLAGIDDLVERKMKIAFSDITDFIEFGVERVPILNNGSVVKAFNPATGKEEVLTEVVNRVRLKDSWEVDGTVIKEITISRQGASIKLEDRQKAQDWLRDFFGENPDSKYKKEFDYKKLQLEQKRLDHMIEMDKDKGW
jgi:phage terminase small subunit